MSTGEPKLQTSYKQGQLTRSVILVKGIRNSCFHFRTSSLSQVYNFDGAMLKRFKRLQTQVTTRSFDVKKDKSSWFGVLELVQMATSGSHRKISYMREQSSCMQVLISSKHLVSNNDLVQFQRMIYLNFKEWLSSCHPRHI